MVVEGMKKWDDLPGDLLWLIIEKLDISDHLSFSAVNTSWRCTGLEYRKTKIPTQAPGLIIPGRGGYSSPTRHFLAYPPPSQPKETPPVVVIKEELLPVLSFPLNWIVRGSYQGWLAIIDFSLNFFLLNPYFKSRRIQLSYISLPVIPTITDTYTVAKVVLSSNPASTSSSCFVLVLCHDRQMYFCNIRDKKWQLLKGNGYSKSPGISDCIFFKQKLYAIHRNGQIFISDLGAPVPILSRLAISISFPEFLPVALPRWSHESRKWYLVEVGDELYLILRDVGSKNETTYDESPDNKRFQVFKFDDNNKWIQVKDFMGAAVFIGFNQSFSLPKSNLMGYAGDVIYFTDDYPSPGTAYGHVGYDMGEFHLQSSTLLHPLFLTTNQDSSSRQPVLWFTPTPTWMVFDDCKPGNVSENIGKQRKRDRSNEAAAVEQVNLWSGSKEARKDSLA